MAETATVRAILMAPQDSVAIALGDLAVGGSVIVKSLAQETVYRLVTPGPVPYGHKLAVRDIAPGEPLLKNGEIIGAASRPIRAGEHAHIHNIVSLRVPPVSQRTGKS